MYIISVMILTFSIRDLGHPKFLESQCGHPVMKILAKSLQTEQFLFGGGMGVEEGGILTDLRPQMTLLSREGNLDLFAGLPGLLWWLPVDCAGPCSARKHRPPRVLKTTRETIRTSGLV